MNNQITVLNVIHYKHPSYKLICINWNISQLCPATVHTDTMPCSQFEALRWSRKNENNNFWYISQYLAFLSYRIFLFGDTFSSTVFSKYGFISLKQVFEYLIKLYFTNLEIISLRKYINLNLAIFLFLNQETKIKPMTHPALHTFSSNQMLSRMSKALP